MPDNLIPETLSDSQIESRMKSLRRLTGVAILAALLGAALFINAARTAIVTRDNAATATVLLGLAQQMADTAVAVQATAQSESQAAATQAAAAALEVSTAQAQVQAASTQAAAAQSTATQPDAFQYKLF